VSSDRRPWRFQWIEAEVRCLQCGRLIGRVSEPIAGLSPTVSFSAFAVFAPCNEREPARYLNLGSRPRCSWCGGNAVLGELERFRINGEPKAIVQKRGRPGRPRRVWDG